MELFPPLKNDLIIRTARQEKTTRSPVWIMRQAGRYLPEYRALRSEGSFFEVVRTPELAAEVTLQPIRRYPLDAAIIFSDILVVPQAMGLEVEMLPGTGPHFPNPLQAPAELNRLVMPNVAAQLDYVFEAISLTRMKLEGKVPLIGFCGAPWTLMAYMIEGGGSKTFSRARSWLYQHPDAAHTLLRQITDVCSDFLIKQIGAGAQLVQVFDSWAGLLGPAHFRQFSLPYLCQIADRVSSAYPDVPKIVFAKGAHYALNTLSESGYEVVGLDWTIDPKKARKKVNNRVALQGNMDPCALYANPSDIRKEVQQMLQAFGPTGHIVNLGHGMHPTHDPEHLRVFIDAVHKFSAQPRQKNDGS